MDRKPTDSAHGREKLLQPVVKRAPIRRPTEIPSANQRVVIGFGLVARQT